ncbi:MAG: hypothetical protein LBK46_06870 [Oscillospiraceae bacterium]|jgi:hypothetical protein|nr:hypothetical protein [Oscillospiraceae bacterium]
MNYTIIDIIKTIVAYLLCAAMTISANIHTERMAAESAQAKALFIDQMLEMALELVQENDFRRAHYKEDLGVCKNFADTLFKSFSAQYRMREYPGARLIIPVNNPPEDCAPHQYGVEWRDARASDGNPFTVVGAFRYNEELSQEENRDAARAVLSEARRGDFLQMSGNYGGGTGPHTLVFTADYDPDSKTLRWTDSNRTGRFIRGERWGYVEYDETFTMDWTIGAICLPQYGATLYRLRDDLVYIGDKR